MYKRKFTPLYWTNCTLSHLYISYKFLAWALTWFWLAFFTDGSHSPNWFCMLCSTWTTLRTEAVVLPEASGLLLGSHVKKGEARPELRPGLPPPRSFHGCLFSAPPGPWVRDCCTEAVAVPEHVSGRLSQSSGLASLFLALLPPLHVPWPKGACGSSGRAIFAISMCSQAHGHKIAVPEQMT